jgi:DNA topoisomerase-3
MLKGTKAYGCSRYREGCSFLIPFDALQRDYQAVELTSVILKKLA